MGLRLSRKCRRTVSLAPPHARSGNASLLTSRRFGEDAWMERLPDAHLHNALRQNKSRSPTFRGREAQAVPRQQGERIRIGRSPPDWPSHLQCSILYRLDPCQNRWQVSNFQVHRSVRSTSSKSLVIHSGFAAIRLRCPAHAAAQRPSRYSSRRSTRTSSGFSYSRLALATGQRCFMPSGKDLHLPDPRRACGIEAGNGPSCGSSVPDAFALPWATAVARSYLRSVLDRHGSPILSNCQIVPLQAPHPPRLVLHHWPALVTVRNH